MWVDALHELTTHCNWVVVAHLVNNTVGDAHDGGPGATCSPGDLPVEWAADGPGGGVTDVLGDGDALGHPSADKDRHTNKFSQNQTREKVRISIELVSVS